METNHANHVKAYLFAPYALAKLIIIQYNSEARSLNRFKVFPFPNLSMPVQGTDKVQFTDKKTKKLGIQARAHFASPQKVLSAVDRQANMSEERVCKVVFCRAIFQNKGE